MRLPRDLPRGQAGDKAIKGKEMDKTELLRVSRTTTIETKYIEFKEHYNLKNKRLLLKLTKEIVAFANTDGGVLLFNIDDNGKICNYEDYKIDLAPLVDKIYKYTGTQYDCIDHVNIERKDGIINAIHISKSKYPLLFEKDGEYKSDKKVKHEFRKGTIYVRHGSKSEIANSNDIRNLINERIDEHMHDFFDKIQIFMDTPAEAHDSISVTKLSDTIRITNDPNAPEFRAEKSDKTHCRRMGYVVEEMNKYINKGQQISQQDIQYVKQYYNIDINSPYCYISKHYPCPVYNDAFIEWLKSEYDKNKMLFINARKAARNNKRKKN